MPKHKFTAGERVTLISNQHNAHMRPGIYVIVRTMPVTSQGCQYRAKSALDNHERVLDEFQLRSV